VLLRADQEVVYFLTLCVLPRKPVLANDQSWTNINGTLVRLDQWRVLSLVVMPDHLHMLVAPLDRDGDVSDFLKWLKRWFNEAQNPDWKWQTGGFDHLLRHDESAMEKWHYLRENPVRAGLVKSWREWPFQFGFSDLENDQ